MSAEELGFDPSLKKKKKAKSKTVDSEESPAPVDSGAEDVATDDVDDMFSGLKKKKKKSKDKESKDATIDEVADTFDGLTLKKKKKKSTKVAADDFDKQLEQAGVSGATAPTQEENKENVENSNFIAYEDLLSRFFTILKENNPELAGGSTSKVKIPPPICQREGSKKTMFANIQEIAAALQRNPEHIIQFLFAELGTSGSIDGQKRLIMRGRFQPKNIENVLKRYIIEYVSCKTCKSMNTELKRESANRLHFIVCKSCGSTKSVSSIKAGFQATVGKRKKV